jgi:ADP-ribose pyrophosphatase
LKAIQEKGENPEFGIFKPNLIVISLPRGKQFPAYISDNSFCIQQVLTMEKWIKKKSVDTKHGTLFTLKRVQCYHPKLDVSYDFSLIETMDWINVVAVTDDDRFILVKQHRLGTDTITRETAGGVIEENESADETALKELIEETGYRPGKMHFMGKLAANPAIMGNHIYFYYAENCREGEGQDLDHIEDIEIELFNADEIIRMLKAGELDHAYVVTALSLFFMSEHGKRFKVFD